MIQNILATIAIFSIFAIIPQTVFGQATVSDLSCITCQEIPNNQALETYTKISPIVIWTDSPIYDKGSTIHVFGHSNSKIKLPVSMRITSPLGNIVSIEQSVPDDNGDFTVQFKPSGELWKKDGNYIITAQLGDGGAGKIFRIQVKVLDYVGSDMLARYEIEGGKVANIAANSKTNSLVITLSDTNTDGMLKVYLSRDIIDAKEPSKQFEGMAGVGLPQQHTTNYDKEFLVLVDGSSFSMIDPNFVAKEFNDVVPTGKYSESTAINTRILIIPFTAGTEKIEIVGTSVVPEFGSYATIILAIAIMSIVLLIRGQKLQLLELTR